MSLNAQPDKITYVVGFAFSEERSRVVLIRKTKPKWQAGYLNGVGGKVEPTDSSAHAAMAREFHEETGVLTEPDAWKYRGIMQGAD